MFARMADYIHTHPYSLQRIDCRVLHEHTPQCSLRCIGGAVLHRPVQPLTCLATRAFVARGPFEDNRSFRNHACLRFTYIFDNLIADIFKRTAVEWEKESHLV